MELYFGNQEKSFWDKLRGVGGPSYDPWTRLRDDRALAKRVAGGLLGVVGPTALAGAFKLQDKFNPYEPFHKLKGSEKKEGAEVNEAYNERRKWLLKMIEFWKGRNPIKAANYMTELKNLGSKYN
tara:strand:+ start:1967 stop:2341 length:375 start_codon:yes stop_codon:yes gene_type:complete